MATRQVVATDKKLIAGRPLARAYISQTEEEFAQLMANLIGKMDEIQNNPDVPSGVKVNAAREMRFVIAEQMKLLNLIESRQDRQELENKSRDIRKMVMEDPHAALDFVRNEKNKLAEFESFLVSLISGGRAIIRPKVIEDKISSEILDKSAAALNDWNPAENEPF